MFGQKMRQNRTPEGRPRAPWHTASADEPVRAQLFPDEPERLKLGRPVILRAERMAPIAEAQRAVHYCGQVVFDWTRLNRHKKLAAAFPGNVLHCTWRPRILVAPLLQEIDAGGGRRDKLVGKAEARLLCAGYCVRIGTQFVVG
jgi:hypothetical protein